MKPRSTLVQRTPQETLHAGLVGHNFTSTPTFQICETLLRVAVPNDIFIVTEDILQRSYWPLELLQRDVNVT